jgi:hypothetical protein
MLAYNFVWAYQGALSGGAGIAFENKTADPTNLLGPANGGVCEFSVIRPP